MVSMSSLWQKVQNQIPHISVEDNFFESTSCMRKFSKFDFSATISNINGQFAPVNTRLNSSSTRLQQLFLKVHPICANDVMEILKV